MKQPKLLDLYCCQGGAAMGYYRAGFEITGVDNKNQPRYPFKFIRSDAISYLLNNWHKYDAIHASPPCQFFTWAANHSTKIHEDLVTSTGLILSYMPIPWIIENVPGVPYNPDLKLNGQMFSHKLIRLRYFFSNIFLFSLTADKRKGSVKNRDYITVAGHGGDGSNKIIDFLSAMQTPWMNRPGVTQAIPPAYTEFIGSQLITYLTNKKQTHEQINSRSN